MRLLKTLVTALLATSVLSAMEKSESAALEYLTIDLDARSVALAGAVSTVPEDGLSHWKNPALLGTLDGYSVSGAFSSYIAGIYLGGMTGSFQFENGIVLAPTLRYLSVGDIAALDRNGDTLNVNLSPFSVDGGVAAGYMFSDMLSFGGKITFSTEQLVGEGNSEYEKASASALLFDAGMYFAPKRTMGLSAGVRNAGFFLKRYENDESSLPASFYAGIRGSVIRSMSLNALAEVEKPINSSVMLRGGLEFLFYKQIIALRVGFTGSGDDISNAFKVLGGEVTSDSESSLSTMHFFSLGGGIKVPIKEDRLSFDFASRILTDGMGVQLYFSGGYSF